MVERTDLAQGRNLKLALVTGFTLAGLLIGLLFIGPKPFFGLVFVVVLIAQAEFYIAARNSGHEPAMALGMVAGAVLLAGVFLKGETAAGVVLFLTIVFSFIWFLALEKTRDLASDLGVTLFGVAYIPLLGSFAGLLTRSCPTASACPPRGGGEVIVMIGAAAFYDIFAYAGGSFFGKTPIAPSISPKKTREGALVATVGTVILVTIVAPLLGPWTHVEATILGLLVSIVAPLGDLFESLVKRNFGIKDMGSVFPGHGGALDRIDAILFVAPVVYLTLLLFGHVHGLR